MNFKDSGYRPKVGERIWTYDTRYMIGDPCPLFWAKKTLVRELDDRDDIGCFVGARWDFLYYDDAYETKEDVETALSNKGYCVISN